MQPTVSGTRIIFKEDGTGQVRSPHLVYISQHQRFETINHSTHKQLHCCSGPATFICATTTWRTIDEDASTAQLSATGPPQQSAAEATIRIEMTLAKTIPEHGYETTLPDVNVDNLEQPAFEPKTFSLHLSTGRFTEDMWRDFDCQQFPPPPAPQQKEPTQQQEAAETDDQDASIKDYFTFTSRIVFDVSPFPPPEEWTMDRGSGVIRRVLALFEFPKLRDFYIED